MITNNKCNDYYNKCNDYCTTNVMITVQQMEWLLYNQCNDYCTTNVMITVQQI